jgi:alcohol dehydrogenase
VLINGASGTLGVCGVISALGLGVRKILGTGRDKKLLAAVKEIAPNRIEVFCSENNSITDWVKSQTDGDGVHAALDCLGPGAPNETFLQALYSLRRGGMMVDVGAVQGEVPIKLHFLSSANRVIVGSLWFSTEEARELAGMAETGALNMSIFEHHGTQLKDINTAISGMSTRRGGFSNFVIYP